MDNEIPETCRNCSLFSECESQRHEDVTQCLEHRHANILPEKMMEETFGVSVGTRVKSISVIDRFDAFLIKDTLTGTVELMNKWGDLAVKVDQEREELKECDNCLLYPDDGLGEEGFVQAFKEEWEVIQD